VAGLMIKIVSAAIKHPVNRTRDEFQAYWQQRHGPLFGRTPDLRRYVQHHALPEAYAAGPQPTHHGASMFWFDSVDALSASPSPRLREVITPADGELYAWYVASRRYGDPDAMTLRETVQADDRQLFDRTPDWPLDHKRATVAAEERIIVDGEVTPGMVKVIWIFARKPGLTVEEFSDHWYHVHGQQLGARLPGMRRYVQNHPRPSFYGSRPMTHDGFSEAWWDSLEALNESRASAEWAALSQDGQTLFTYPMATIVSREFIVKDFA
jgi:uncharacterized protein (TIGR02118 family)